MDTPKLTPIQKYREQRKKERLRIDGHLPHYLRLEAKIQDEKDEKVRKHVEYIGTLDLKKEKRRRYEKEYRKKKKPGQEPKNKYIAFKSRSKIKGITNTITFKEWTQIKSGQKCYYCGISKTQYSMIMTKLKQTKELYTNLHRKSGNYSAEWHIDKISPQKGYTKDNIATSCKFCNEVKGRLLDPEDMKLLKGSMRAKLLNVITTKQCVFP